jgi:hypothetical protein
MLELVDRIREHVAYQTREHYPRQTGSRIFPTALLIHGLLDDLDALDATASLESPLSRNGIRFPTPSIGLAVLGG